MPALLMRRFPPSLRTLLHRVLELQRAAVVRSRSSGRARFVLLLLGGSLGCGHDSATAPPASTVGFWTLQLNQHAVNMATQAPENTIQLVATPYTTTGAPLTTVGTVHFYASDSTVTVDSLSGLVTAHFSTQGNATPVTAKLTVQGVTRTDVAWIQVTDTVPRYALATFSMQPTAGDSAKRAVDWMKYNGLDWSVVATDAAPTSLCTRGTPCPLVVAYSASDSTVATIDQLSGSVHAKNPGRVVFTATTWAYGVTKRDSVVFTVGYGIALGVNQGFFNPSIFINVDMTPGGSAARASFAAPPTVVLGVGAIVGFRDRARQRVDVTFDDTTAVDTASCPSVLGSLGLGLPYAPPTGGGDIAPFGGDTTWVGGYQIAQFDADEDLRCRWFPVAGVYRYHSTVVPSDTLTLIVHP